MKFLIALLMIFQLLFNGVNVVFAQQTSEEKRAFPTIESDSEEKEVVTLLSFVLNGRGWTYIMHKNNFDVPIMHSFNSSLQTVSKDELEWIEGITNLLEEKGWDFFVRKGKVKITNMEESSINHFFDLFHWLRYKTEGNENY